MGNLRLMAMSRPAWVIRASDELTIITGQTSHDLSPAGRVALIYEQAGEDVQATLRMVLAMDLAAAAGGQANRIVLLVCTAAFRNLGGPASDVAGRQGYHLPLQCRAIASAITAPLPGLSKAAAEAYSTAKAVELLCETLRLLNEGSLVKLAPAGTLSLADSRRIIAARDMIEQRCGEKLTLNGIARACGINRAKLTRGFRDMFACTIAEAITDQRLQQAGRLLLTTDLPVACVGHESGFLNNASFARAFGRHYGRSPSRYRAQGAVA